MAAASNSGSHSAGSLPVLAGALAEAVRSHNAGDRQRFALMSGFAVGLMFANPEPGPRLTEAEVVEGAIYYYGAMAELGRIGSDAGRRSGQWGIAGQAGDGRWHAR